VSDSESWRLNTEFNDCCRVSGLRKTALILPFPRMILACGLRCLLIQLGFGTGRRLAAHTGPRPYVQEQLLLVEATDFSIIWREARAVPGRSRRGAARFL
jgi:hypothetical protein